jgi:hypothetical protein
VTELPFDLCQSSFIVEDFQYYAAQESRAHMAKEWSVIIKGAERQVCWLQRDLSALRYNLIA